MTRRYGPKFRGVAVDEGEVARTGGAGESDCLAERNVVAVRACYARLAACDPVANVAWAANARAFLQAPRRRAGICGTQHADAR